MFYKTLHFRLATYLELMCFKLSQLSNYMSVFAVESQYMKTIVIHLEDKSDFILSDQETRCKSLQ